MHQRKADNVLTAREDRIGIDPGVGDFRINLLRESFQRPCERIVPGSSTMAPLKDRTIIAAMPQARQRRSIARTARGARSGSLRGFSSPSHHFICACPS